MSAEERKKMTALAARVPRPTSSEWKRHTKRTGVSKTPVSRGDPQRILELELELEEEMERGL
jgi:hypothetical protein